MCSRIPFAVFSVFSVFGADLTRPISNQETGLRDKEAVK
jgi:hypothetical protein